MFLKELLILGEGRIEYTASTFADKLLASQEKDRSAKQMSALDLVKEIAKADPTKNTQHIVWLSKMYIDGGFKLEDVSKIKDELTLFIKVKAKLQNKDLNSYRSLNDLYDVLEPFYDKSEDDLMSNKAKMSSVKSGAKVFFEKPGFKVVIPVTHEAAQLYGSGTKWCTSAKECTHFDSYSKQGDLMILLVQLDGKNRKFQLHYETDSFMDERDQAVSKDDMAKLSALPEYKEFLNKLIKLHYSQHLE